MATGTNVGSLFWSTGLETSGLRRDSKKAQGALSGLFKPSILGAAALTTAILKAGTAALSFSRDFETAFAEVQTISESARENAESMRETILRMTTEIPIGAVDATRALYQIVSAGFDGASAMKVLEVSAKAAVAGVTTTAIAADTLTTIINAYGLAASDVTEVSDALFKTVELGKTTLAEIGSSFSQVASLAAAFGIPLNEVLAALAAMTKQGTSTSEAITNIRSAMVSITEKLGEGAFQGRSLADAFQEARDEAEKAGEGLRSYLGRVQAVLGVLQVTGDKQKIFSDSLDKINESAGSTNNALAIMNDTLEAQETLFKSNLNVLLGQFGDQLNEIKKNVLPGLNAELQVLADKSIPGYAKALSVLANSVNIGLLFGGRAFSAEQFSPEIVRFQKEAERQVEGFHERTDKLADDAFEKEVERVRKAKEINKDALQDIQDRKEKGQQFDEDNEKEARQRALTFYKILESAEARLTKIREETPPPGGEGGKDPVKKKPRTFADIKQDITDTQDAIDLATKAELADLALRLDALQKEKQAWIDIADAAILAQRNVIPPAKIKAIEAPQIGKTIDIKTLQGVNAELQKINKQIVEGAKKAKILSEELDIEKKANLAENFRDASTALNDLSGLVSKFDEELGKTISTVAELAGGLANVFAGLASGNIFQTIGGIAQAISSLITSKQINDTERYTEAVKDLGLVYKDLNVQIDRALGEERITSRVETIKNIEAQIKALENLIQAEGESVKVIKFLGITIFRKSNSDLEAIEGYTEQIAELNREIQQIIIDTTELVTGTTGAALANSLVDAFQIGEDAAKEFGEVVNDVLKNAVQSALARKFLEQPLQDALNLLEADFADASRAGEGLTEQEAAEFKTRVTEIGQTYADALAAAGEALGLDFGGGGTVGEDTGLAGAIRREITEETAGLILGQFSAFRVDMRLLNDITANHTEILTESAGYLQQIALNTENNAALPRIETQLEELNTNIKNQIA